MFGIICGLVIVRGNVRGRGFLDAFVDLPLSLSPVIVGFSFIALYGINGWLGWFQRNGYEVIFATPSIVLATIFVTLPFVAREVVPTLAGRSAPSREQAALDPRRLGSADPSRASRSCSSGGRSCTASSSPRHAPSASTARWRSSR